MFVVLHAYSIHSNWWINITNQSSQKRGWCWVTGPCET